MSSTAQAVRNAAAALKKAADPWNKEDREIAERLVSAAISMTDTPSLDQDILDMLSGLLRRPFAELYLTHPGAALRLSAAMFTTMVHDKISQSWKARDSQSRSNWEQVAVILLSGVQDHVEAHSNERVKIVVAQAYYAVICNALFSASSSIPLSTYSVSFRVSAYSLLSMTADGCVENKNKLRDSKILGGAKLGHVITSTKDYLSLEQLLILLAYLLPPTEGKAAGRAERLRFLRDCFADSTQSGKDLIELLKYVASPDWEVTADKIIDILARDISVSQPFIMKSFVLNRSSNSRINPANRFYVDKTSFLFNCEDEDGKIEGMHLPFDSIRSIDISSSGTVVAQLLNPPQCHENLQMISNNVAITMTVVIASNDVEHFSKILRIRGMTSRIKLNGIPIQRATHRSSIIISPTRLEFEDRAQRVTSYQSKVKVVEEGVLQASDPGDVIVPNLEVSIDKLQDEQPLLAKECPSSQDLPSAPTPAPTHETKVHHDGGCHHVFSASSHQLPSVQEDSQKRPTTLSLASGPPLPPRSTNYPPLHSPRASGPPYRCYDGNNAATVNSSPSGHSHHDSLSDKVLNDAIFCASDEELSSLSDTDSIFCAVQSSSGTVKSRRVIRGSSSSKHPACSQRRRHPHLSSRPTSLASNLNSAQDPAPEQKLAPMVKRPRVIESQDSQDSTRDKLADRAAAAAKRKKILIDSEDEIEATACIPTIAKELPCLPTSNLGPEKKAPRKKRQSGVTTAQDRVAVSERPRRACVASSSNVKANVKLKSLLSAADSNTVEVKKELTGGRDKGNIAQGDHVPEQQEPARMVKLQDNGLATEGDVPVASSKHGPSRKRARVEPENISLPRNRPTRRSKKDAPVSKAPKAAPSQVRKTYRKRQKIERSSPGHCVDRGVDYDEIPPSAAGPNSSTAKRRTLPPKKSTRPADETNNDKKEKGEAKQMGVCLVQVPPTEVVLDDDDPIQSFSSSPSELLPPVVDAPGPQTSVLCDAGNRSDCVSQAGSSKKGLDVTPSAATTPTGCRENVITETKSVMTSQPTACDTLQHSVTEDASASVEIQSAPFPAATNDEDQGISNGFTDLDYLDGPTIIAEQSTERHETENISVTPKPIVETIDLTGSTPSPVRSPIARCIGEEITFPHDVPTSSPAPKSRTTDDTTDSSMLDLTDTKYRDFDVSLDSSLCLPSNKTSSIKRPPTPPPPRTKRKSVTFAAPLEKVVEERLETQATLEEAMIPNHLDELEYLEQAPELARGNGSSSRVDGFHSLSKRLAIEPQSARLSPRCVSPAAEPLSLLFSPLATCPSRPYATEAPPSTAIRAKQIHRARDASTSPSTKAETTAPGSYLIPIMTVLDEIHTVVKSNIQTRFERFNGHVVELRRRILAQTQADMTALLDEYIKAYNSLVSLEAKYGAFSGRRIAAFTQARNAHAQSLTALRAHIQTHDRVMQEHARHTFAVGPLPAAVRRWL